MYQCCINVSYQHTAHVSTSTKVFRVWTLGPKPSMQAPKSACQRIGSSRRIKGVMRLLLNYDWVMLVKGFVVKVCLSWCTHKEGMNNPVVLQRYHGCMVLLSCPKRQPIPHGQACYTLVPLRGEQSLVGTVGNVCVAASDVIICHGSLCSLRQGA